MGQGFYGFPNILDIVRATTFKAIGKAGASNGAALAGGTASGAPVAPAGPFDQGDVIVDATGSLWICSVAGTSQSSPGTFVQVGPSPLSTKGDLYGYGTAGTRVPIGGDGTVLTADSTQALGLKWGTPGSGGGAGNMSYQGAWASGTTYNVNDVVTYSSHLWICAVSNTGVTPAGTGTLWQGATPSVVGDSGLGANANYGNEWYSDNDGTVTAIKFYKASSDTGTHTGTIYDKTSGTQLAQVTFSGETASGWQSQALSSALSITASTHYVVALHTQSTHMSYSTNAAVSPSSGLHIVGSTKFDNNTAIDNPSANTSTGNTWAVDVSVTPTGASDWTQLA